MNALTLYAPQLFIVPWLQRKINELALGRAVYVRKLGAFVVEIAEEDTIGNEVPEQFLDITNDIFAVPAHLLEEIPRVDPEVDQKRPVLLRPTRRPLDSAAVSTRLAAPPGRHLRRRNSAAGSNPALSASFI